MLWMGLGSWALQMIFCIPPAGAATYGVVLFPQYQSSPSVFSSTPRIRCSRVLESPIAVVLCRAVLCSDVTINNYRAMKSKLRTLLIGTIIIHTKMWAFSWGAGETRAPEENLHDFFCCPPVRYLKLSKSYLLGLWIQSSPSYMIRTAEASVAIVMRVTRYHHRPIIKWNAFLRRFCQTRRQKATSWYESNSLKGNYGKYGSMFISRVNKLKDYKLKLNVNGTDIKPYDSITLLGVDIDNALNFSGHISNMCKKSSQRVGVINRLRNLIP